MKCKLLSTTAVVPISSGVIAWLTLGRDARIPGGLPTGLSQEDFMQIRQTIRHEMWRTGFPSFSWQTLKNMPRALVLLATSSICEVELLGTKDNVQVRTHSHFGHYFFVLAKARQPAGQWGYRMHNRGPYRIAGFITPYRGPESFGKALSVGDRVYEMDSSPFPRSISSLTTTQRPVFNESEFSALLSNHAKLTIHQ